jgi:UDP-N-acetyl-D-mannosaminuronic acid transferase (WecB/TagA/CpsF family)
MNPPSKIIGLSFLNETPEKIFEILNEQGGLMTVPSGPGIASIPNEPLYYEALLTSDWCIADSGLMALVWNKISKNKVRRVSGLGFLNAFVVLYPKHQNQKLFLVNPTVTEQGANVAYFNSIGVQISEAYNYLAPMYAKNEITDSILLRRLEDLKPHFIMLNIGGGVQEVLGCWLKQNLSYKPAIICTGAAIAFKTGQQTQIPVWVDKLYLGWLWRVIENPKKYGKRFWEARKAVSLILKYREKQVYEISTPKITT